MISLKSYVNFYGYVAKTLVSRWQGESLRQVAEMVKERGEYVHHTTVFRWIQQYAPGLDKRCRPHLKSTNDPWRVDETYIKAECRRRKIPPFPFLLVKGKDRYLYRAVDSDGNTLDFLLAAKRDLKPRNGFSTKC